MDIEKVEKLLRDISKCGGTSCSVSDEYNIFEVLGVEYKEVIMCRFIGNLLDPKGGHGLGTEPLQLFIQDVLGDEIVGDNLEDSEIKLEDSTENGRRVDLAIYLNNKIYPIEVKIWAGDQNDQLKDYHEFYFGKNKNAKIYYLTPNGHSPSDESKGDLKEGEDGQIVCISFTGHIKDWLTEVCKIESASENIKSVIRNFKEVIDKMGQNEKELSEIMKLLKLDDNEVYDREVIQGAVLLLKHRDEIWYKIRRNYIENNTIQNNDFKLEPWGGEYEPCGEEDDGVSHVLFYVTKNGKKVAWICVEKYLYIVARKKQKKSDDGWKTYDDKYQWKHIKSKSKKIQLRNPTKLKDDLKINLADLLTGVIDQQDSKQSCGKTQAVL